MTVRDIDKLQTYCKRFENSNHIDWQPGAKCIMRMLLEGRDFNIDIPTGEVTECVDYKAVIEEILQLISSNWGSMSKHELSGRINEIKELLKGVKNND